MAAVVVELRAGGGFEEEVGEGVLPGLRELFDGRDGLGELRGHGAMIASRGVDSKGCRRDDLG